MSEENKDKNAVVEKKGGKLTEETVQIVSNVIVTAVSVAALAFSIAANLKGKRRG